MTCVIDREDPVSTERVDDPVSVERAFLSELVKRVCPAEATVKGLQHPDVSISLGTGGRGVAGGWLLGVEEVEHLQGERGGGVGGVNSFSVWLT